MVRRNKRPQRIALALLLTSLHLAAACPAHAVRHVFVGAQLENQGGIPSTNFQGIAVTPDGLHGYSAQNAGAALFDRDPLTGALTFVSNQGTSGGDSQVARGEAVGVSPDGAHVYYVESNVVRGYSRNTTTGDLTFVNEVGYTSPVPGLYQAKRFAISPDGADLYVSGAGFGTVVVLARNATTGALNLVETHEDGVAGVDGLAGARGVAVSPDGAHVYVAGTDDWAVAVFARSAIDGTLTFLGTVTGPSTLFGVSAVDVSPDGAHVYTAGAIGVLGVFARDSGSGMLTIIESESLPFADYRDLVVGPDGLHVFATDSDGILRVWARDTLTGQISLEDTLPTDLPGGSHSFWGLAVSSDGRNVYAADRALAGSSVHSFRRVEVACSQAPLSSCLGLSPSQRSKLAITDNLDDRKDKLTWKWIDPTPLGPVDFGDPVAALNDYALCVYDASGSPQPLAAPLAPAAGGCDPEDGGLTPCWTSIPGLGFKYHRKDRVPDGTTPVKLLADAAGKVRILFKSKGEDLPMPTLPLTLPVTVQLQNAAGGCWEATYSTFTSNDAAIFKAIAD